MRIFQLLLLLALTPGAAGAEETVVLRLCTLDQPFPPFTHPDGNGSSQLRLKQALQGLPIRIDNYVAPRPRCLYDLQTGRADALLATFSRERLAFAVFPMRAGKPDQRRAIDMVGFQVYRRRGTGVSWDGKRFSGLRTGVVGTQSGFAQKSDLQALGLKVDDGAKSVLQNMEKLAAGRFDAVVLYENEAQRVADDFREQLELLPQPFMQTGLFLMVGREFARQHARLVEASWDAIGHLPPTSRQAPEPAR